MNENQQTELERKLRARMDAEEKASSDAEHMLETSAPEADDPAVETEEEAPAVDTLDPVEALEAKAEELKDQLLRSRAEFENFRKRTAREVERIRKTATESVIHDLLPVLDNLELALEHAEDAVGPIADGIKMVLKQLLGVLERNGLEPIEALGRPFDPKVHEAISEIESAEVPKDNVAQEFQRGYTLGGQILRPSKVVVSLGENETENSE